MKIHRINNIYHNELEPSISTDTIQFYMTNNKLHRGGGLPAVVTTNGYRYYWRGILISEKIAKRELSKKEILSIENAEIRQAAIEILGYEKFFEYSKKIDFYTPPQFNGKYSEPMYTLFKLDLGKDELGEDILLLMMIDPSKEPIVKYFIRVAPNEKSALEAVAHSYGFENPKDYLDNKVWV